MKLVIKVIIGFCFLFSFSSLLAWNAVGHMVIAQIAYDKLNPNAKKKVDVMVGDLGKEYPEIVSFYQLGPWADNLRSQKIDIYSHWHYTDMAFSVDDTPVKNITDTDNVVWAIGKIKPIVSNDKANPFERARFLALLVHVVSDIHQPLHTSSRISAKTPNGDQGGNLYYIKYPVAKPQTMPIHRLWDQGIDIFSIDGSSETITALSHQIMSLYPETYFPNKKLTSNVDMWANEGLSVSKSFVYSATENQVPSEAYLKTARQLAQEKAALAGYRLATMLNELLG